MGLLHLAGTTSASCLGRCHRLDRTPPGTCLKCWCSAEALCCHGRLTKMSRWCHWRSQHTRRWHWGCEEVLFLKDKDDPQNLTELKHAVKREARSISRETRGKAFREAGNDQSRATHSRKGGFTNTCCSGWAVERGDAEPVAKKCLINWLRDEIIKLCLWWRVLIWFNYKMGYISNFHPVLSTSFFREKHAGDIRFSQKWHKYPKKSFNYSGICR